MHDAPLPNTESRLRALFTKLARHGPLLVVSRPARINRRVAVAVARSCGHQVAYLPSLAMRRIADLYPGTAKTGAAVDLARRIDTSRIALTERKASLFIDTASAFAMWGKHEQAYRALRMAEQVAPEEVRTQGEVHRLVEQIAVRGPRDVRGRAREFAALIGVPL